MFTSYAKLQVVVACAYGGLAFLQVILVARRRGTLAATRRRLVSAPM